MLTKPYRLDNLQTASMRLNDMLHGYFAEINSPVTTIDSARAVCEILCDIKKNLVARGLIENVTLTYEFDGVAMNNYIRKISKNSSNFAKHADQKFSKLNHFKAESEIFLIGSACVDFHTVTDAMEKAGLIDKPENFRTKKLARICMLWITDMGKFMMETSYLPKREWAELMQREMFDGPNSKSQVLEFLKDHDAFTTNPADHVSMKRDGAIEFEHDMPYISDLQAMFPDRF